MHLSEVAYRLVCNSECTVLTVTVSVENDPLQACDRGNVCHLKCFTYGTFPEQCSTLLSQVHRDFSLTVPCVMGMAEGYRRWCRVGTVWFVALSTQSSLLTAVAISYFLSSRR